MADPLVNTQFTSGTVITSDWLNGINDFANEAANPTIYTQGAARIGFDGGSVTSQFLSKVNRVVDSIAALRLVDKTKYTRAFSTGYYTMGDGGGGPYWYDSSDTTSVDNGGTVIVGADGGRWKLILTGWLSVKQFGAKGDGAFDDSGPIQGALSALNNTTITDIYFPGGQYRTTVQLSVQNKQVHIHGAGQQCTVIQCEMLSGICLFIDQLDYTFYTKVEGLSFTTNQIAQVTALEITYGENDATNNRIQDRVTLRDLQMFGSVFGLVGPKYGVKLNNVHAAYLENINIAGNAYAAGMLAGCFFTSSGTGAPSDIVCHNVKVYYGEKGFQGTGHLEGMNFSQCFAIAVQVGFHFALSTTFPWFTASQCHVNCTSQGFHLENFPQSFIRGNLIYIVNQAAASTPVGISLTACDDTIVTDNNVVNPTFVAGTQVIGYLVNNSIRVKLANNKVAGYDVGYDLIGTTGSTRTFDNEASTGYGGSIAYNDASTGGGNMVRNTP